MKKPRTVWLGGIFNSTSREVQVKESYAVDLSDEGLGLMPSAVADIETHNSVLNSNAVLVEDERNSVLNIGVGLH